MGTLWSRNDPNYPSTMRRMILIALQAQNCTDHVSSWRHLSRTDSWSPTIGRHIGRCSLDFAFFDDAHPCLDIYGRNHEHTVRHGIRWCGDGTP
jgi:hypothetical protein